jgi:hypothetical protein
LTSLEKRDIIELTRRRNFVALQHKINYV